MTPIPIKTYPLERTYSSAEAAIAGAKAHPLQTQAKADSKRLEGTRLLDGYWTFKDFVLQFSNAKWLHIFTERSRVRWRVTETAPVFDEAVVEQVGAPPVVIAWGGELGDRPMDRSALVTQRGGTAFWNLWVNEGGLLVYTRGHPILYFHVLCRTDTGEDILFVDEDD